jgi:ParB-like chromosome segregation protein Spo0J
MPEKIKLSIKINPEYEALVPKLSKSEFELLTSSIKEKGLREYIIVNDKGIILDGHHRFRACQILGIECQFSKKFFGNLLEEKLYVIDANLQRRQLNDVQKVHLNLVKKPILQELAKLNMSRGGKGVQIYLECHAVHRHHHGSLNYLALKS